MYIGEGGAGNYVKMVHNGIEYGDMQVCGEEPLPFGQSDKDHLSH